MTTTARSILAAKIIREAYIGHLRQQQRLRLAGVVLPSQQFGLITKRA